MGKFKRIYLFLLLMVVSCFLGNNYGFPTAEPRDISRFTSDVYGIIKKLILMEEKISVLTKSARQESQIDRLENKLRGVGATYIRWGKTVCPENNTVVYTGFMAGSYNTDKGAGSNYLCLTDEPLWDHYEESVTGRSRITGTEYRFYPHKKNGASDFFGDNMWNQDVPCAVCYTWRSVSLMIPGRNRCYDGWTMEYSGYLVSGYTADASSTEFVCLDRRPEKVANGEDESKDNKLFFVEASCGKSLSCPPYVSGRELTCVVCSL